MTQELVYTSAASGLKPGSKGFCTIAATNGIAPRTVTLLESLSGYRHAFPPNESPNPANPTAWMHLHTSGGDSLLSRVADAGLDYSGRSNKIAHHVLLSSNERTDAGPTAMLREDGNLLTTWQGPARWLTARNPHGGTLDPGKPASIPAMTWNALTGDAGWAGVLAQAAQAPTQPECYVIYGAGQEHQILALFDEAVALLPPSHRWQVTFNTFFSKLPPGMACQWRGILKGSPEHRLVPPHNRVVTIDLTASLAAAPDGPLVQYARTGDAVSAGELSALAAVDRIEPFHSGDAPTKRPQSRESGIASNHPNIPGGEGLSFANDQPPQLDLATNIINQEIVTTSRSRPKSRLPWIAFVASMLLAPMVVGGYAIWHTVHPSSIEPITKGPADPNIVQRDTRSITAPESTSELEIKPDSEPQTSEPPNTVDTADATMAIPNETMAIPAATMAIPSADTETQSAIELPVNPSDLVADPKPSLPPPPTSDPEPLPESIRLVYLLEPAMWRQWQRSGEQWNQDQSVDRRPLEMIPPTTVEVLTLASDGEMTVDEKFNYNSKTHTVVWGEPDRGILQPPSKVIRFEPGQVILQVNYAQRIGNRFLFATADDESTLLTLQGADTPVSGMNERLTVNLDLQNDKASVVVPLGAINPGLLSLADVTLRSSQPDRWRSVRIDEGIELERSFGKRQQLNAPPTRVSVNVRLRRNEEPRLLINATVEKPGEKARRQSSALPADQLDLGSVQTARNELPANHIDVDLIAEFRWQTRHYTTTLSQFRLAFK
ncbi:GAP1-N2 domain-containing protein [Neorhodopirellula pilleata]|uniref:Transmembrane protein n=1 Tax=Neorhodopirellula pilleata TaxID=2714738 RepID=A0A5C5ZLI8_9BACT|nr:hypothetical protein [Neorhodopirellula pilleata]TWT87847.1 hypothetical protein Pla100_58860 [Neorhodopirellula pilleata]